MSYDLFFFDPSAAPRDHAAFVQWFKSEAESDEYSFEPTICSAPLQAVFNQLTLIFPPLNGSFAPPDIVDRPTEAGDYTLRPASIYACFSWPKAPQAAKLALQYAETHHVGLLDLASDTLDVYWPTHAGMEVIRRPNPRSWWKKIFGVSQK